MNKTFTGIVKGLFCTLFFCANSNAQDSLEWSFDGTYRLRFEYLNNTFRPASEHDDDQLVASRLLAGIKLNYRHFVARAEMQDSRVWLDNDATPLGTDDVNTLEPLQYWLGWESDQLAVRIGRQTLDIGSRRFVARNRFRNTLNAFSGIYAKFNADDLTIQGFYFNPVTRLPDNVAALDNNSAQFDATSDNIFKGVHADYHPHTHMEVFYYEYAADQVLNKTRTIGLRLHNSDTAVRWHYDAETAYQFGSVQSKTVKAAMLHAEIGYTFALPHSPQLAVLADYASGDNRPDDDKYTVFNTLSGARRFDFGPTGIYGAFARRNILSTGLLLNLKPSAEQNSRLVYRAVWLDADTTESKHRFLGHQFEIRWRFPLSDIIRFELGGAYLYKSQHISLAPDNGNSTYFYSQTTIRF